MSGEREPPRALAVVGPTATGKTAVAAEVARRLDGEIVSVDSRQAYRGMEVGTAAPPRELRREIPHHGVAFLSPGERYGAGRFARLARRWIREIRGRGRVPILAGGTGFFLKALTDPVFEEPEMDGERRESLRAWMDATSDELLLRWARRLDPVLAERMDPLDPQRASRTLELALLSGRPLSWWHDHGEPEAPPLRARIFVLELATGPHRRRIERRTRELLEAGWPEEARALREEGHGPGSPALDALGYRDVARLLDGEIDRQEAVERIAGDTWQYARRQRTWFRHQVPEEDTVRVDAAEPVEQLAGRIAEDWSRHAGGGSPGESGRESGSPEEGGSAAG